VKIYGVEIHGPSANALNRSQLITRKSKDGSLSASDADRSSGTSVFRCRSDLHRFPFSFLWCSCWCNRQWQHR